MGSSQSKDLAQQQVAAPNADSNNTSSNDGSPNWHIEPNSDTEGNEEYAERWNRIGRQLIQARNLAYRAEWQGEQLSHSAEAIESLKAWSKALDTLRVEQKKKASSRDAPGKHGSRKPWRTAMAKPISGPSMKANLPCGWLRTRAVCWATAPPTSWLSSRIN